MLVVIIVAIGLLIWAYKKYRFSQLPEADQRAIRQRKADETNAYMLAIRRDPGRPKPYIRGVGQANDQLNPAYIEWCIQQGRPVPRRDDSYDGFLD